MYDVIVIGSGPAGIMAAITASKHNRVLLIEKNNEIGKKLKLTGGGRCNITNLKDNQSFINELHNGKYLDSVLNNFNSKALYNYFEDLGVKLKIEDHDRVFPITNNSITIIDALKRELINPNIDIKYNTTVLDIRIDHLKTVITDNGDYTAGNIIIATGGKSYPETGSTGDGYQLALKLGHTINELYPAETYVIIKDKFPLAGITLDEVTITSNNNISEGSLLFTHNGLSGPSIFKLSEHIYQELKTTSKASIFIDFKPHISINELLTDMNNYPSKIELKTWVKTLLPNRLSEYLCSNLGSIKIASLSKLNREIILNKIKHLVVEITDTGKLQESIITGGGINIDEIDPKTMESKHQKGIYFVGELLDLHGPMGGYNLTIAFTAGYTAGSNINKG